MRLAALSLLLALCACGSSPAPDGALPNDGSMPIDLTVDQTLVENCAPVSVTSDPTCNDCLAHHCCTVIAACSDDGGCSGVWDRSAVFGCMTNACATACGKVKAHCGGIQAQPASCASCLFKNCCDLATQCGMDDACLALIYQCIDKQNGSTADCEMQFPTGMADFEALNTCGTNACPGCF